MQNILDVLIAAEWDGLAVVIAGNLPVIMEKKDILLVLGVNQVVNYRQQKPLN